MAGSTDLIRLEQVVRTYDGGRIQALRGASVTVTEGETVAIVGRSGSGKSTLLHLMAGLDTPDEGRVIWRGREAPSRSDWDRLRTENIGMVFQSFHLLPVLSAVENVEIPMRGTRQRATDRRRRALALLEAVGLADRVHHRPGELSGGERQRVAIARSLANGPDLLLADEPTGNLDQAAADRVMDLLLEQQKAHGTALVLVTHEHAVADRLGRRITVHDGRVADDRPQTPHTEEPPA